MMGRRVRRDRDRVRRSDEKGSSSHRYRSPTRRDAQEDSKERSSSKALLAGEDGEKAGSRVRRRKKIGIGVVKGKGEGKGRGIEIIIEGTKIGSRKRIATGRSTETETETASGSGNGTQTRIGTGIEKGRETGTRRDEADEPVNGSRDKKLAERVQANGTSTKSATEDKDPHTLEREARNRERMLKEQQRRQAMNADRDSRSSRRLESKLERSLLGGRRLSYKYEDEADDQARAARVEQEREAARWG
ncbi:hypothetical protein CISG_06777 [Coccidioides immitis RMSCC 3703]|uniref:Uncharacterized protein n=1 Tax=Coccidioides immitis RMSCC 3703 TaxID=454286 RepID=A0A0J8QYG1_COCIT|nr:hypothetical protein CISG_06777 [Coccidioides immitis RMSCC 3703]